MTGNTSALRRLQTDYKNGFNECVGRLQRRLVGHSTKFYMSTVLDSLSWIPTTSGIPDSLS